MTFIHSTPSAIDSRLFRFFFHSRFHAFSLRFSFPEPHKDSFVFCTLNLAVSIAPSAVFIGVGISATFVPVVPTWSAQRSEWNCVASKVETVDLSASLRENNGKSMTDVSIENRSERSKTFENRRIAFRVEQTHSRLIKTRNNRRPSSVSGHPGHPVCT